MTEVRFGLALPMSSGPEPYFLGTICEDGTLILEEQHIGQGGAMAFILNPKQTAKLRQILNRELSNAG